MSQPPAHFEPQQGGTWMQNAQPPTQSHNGQPQQAAHDDFFSAFAQQQQQQQHQQQQQQQQQHQPAPFPHHNDPATSSAGILPASFFEIPFDLGDATTGQAQLDASFDPLHGLPDMSPEMYLGPPATSIPIPNYGNNPYVVPSQQPPAPHLYPHYQHQLQMQHEHAPQQAGHMPDFAAEFASLQASLGFDEHGNSLPQQQQQQQQQQQAGPSRQPQPGFESAGVKPKAATKKSSKPKAPKKEKDGAEKEKKPAKPKASKGKAKDVAEATGGPGSTAAAGSTTMDPGMITTETPTQLSTVEASKPKPKKSKAKAKDKDRDGTAADAPATSPLADATAPPPKPKKSKKKAAEKASVADGGSAGASAATASSTSQSVAVPAAEPAVGPWASAGGPSKLSDLAGSSPARSTKASSAAPKKGASAGAGAGGGGKKGARSASRMSSLGPGRAGTRDRDSATPALSVRDSVRPGGVGVGPGAGDDEDDEMVPAVQSKRGGDRAGGADEDDVEDEAEADAEMDGDDELRAGDYEDQERIYAAQQKNMGLLSMVMTPEQLDRHMASRRGALNKASVRKLVNHVLSQSVNAHVAMVAAGVAKIFVGEIVEAARRVQQERRQQGPLKPIHLLEAHRRYRSQRERPGYFPPGRDGAMPGLGKRRRLF
ncbi:uncharacterized protein PFL1_02582 [Pseudozyma flocculosa PF-1]|uniref:TAFII28-like protein domain-containing protein n=1 Tax=Pseudozyma flocculosa PF-1 TaxID=1277687 RepID=A0A061HBQ3_9BASI|nr:uncharacterized protein PFL1_02582 [Pseudozyma flocculosa PF-1]EPQ29909.1 hypothetical protein PFL1_02582 [Pseudozyma flocculosa PF-1]